MRGGPVLSGQNRRLMEAKIDLTKEYGLVLEGGGAKGAYQIGAWKALKEAGVKIKGVSGTSVGALNGALICMGDMERAESLWSNIAYSQIMDVDDELMASLFDRTQLTSELLRESAREVFRMLGEGGIDITPLRQLIEENIDEEAIRRSPVEFYSCTYSLTDRQEMNVDMKALPEGQMKDMLLASAYLPGFKNEKLLGKTYVDGGTTNVLPADILDMKALPEGQMKDMLLASAYLPGFKNEKLLGKTYVDGGTTNVLPADILLERGYAHLILLRIFGIGREKKISIPEGVTVLEAGGTDEGYASCQRVPAGI